MKIGIDLSSLDNNFSGIERYALEMAKHIIKNNIKYNILLFFKNNIYIEFKNKKYDTVTYVCTKSKSRLLFMLFKLPKLIKKYQIDYMYFPAFPPSIFLKKNTKTKIISMIHDLVPWDAPNTMTLKSKIYFMSSIKHALKISNYITTNSNFTKSRISEKFKIDLNKIFIMPMGISNTLKLDLKTNIRPLNFRYFLTVGTLEPRKNFIKLVEFYNRLPNKEIKLVVVGRIGWKSKELEEKMKRNPNIHYLGFVDDTTLNNLYKNADAFLFFSIYEGFGTPVLESISKGLLPIASNIPTNYEILGDDYPFIFNLDSYDSFEEKIIQLYNISTEQKEKLISNLKDRTKLFSLDTTSNNFLKMIGSNND